jgi:hypothetical protein
VPDHILTESGDRLMAESGDLLVLEPAAIVIVQVAPSGRAGVRRFNRLPRLFSVPVPPPVPVGYILTESGDRLMTESGDLLHG